MYTTQQSRAGGGSLVTPDAWGLEGAISVCTSDGGGDCVHGRGGVATSAIGRARSRGFQGGGTGFRGRIFRVKTIGGTLAVAIFDARFLRRCLTVGRFFGRPSHRTEGRPRQEGHCWEISSLFGGFGGGRFPFQGFTGFDELWACEKFLAEVFKVF